MAPITKRVVISDNWLLTAPSCLDLTDVTVADQDTNSMLTDKVNRAINGNVVRSAEVKCCTPVMAQSVAVLVFNDCDINLPVINLLFDDSAVTFQQLVTNFYCN